MTVRIKKDTVATRELVGKLELQDQYIGSAEVSSKKISVQDELNIPAGNSDSRPTNIPAGSTRWNTETSELEIYDGTNWLALVADYTPTGSMVFG